ncbi:class I SAM-dependent methyltransferase [Nonomuraea sediminis]|uniref:class I SAM-dependent methyltransferase n=1 Tax=Nonomuraea sediminis TaxID=2835864 RepID=UPI001BDD62C4|nr:class I SAM-dependent methyltransferase [Nonomuraea sediminis]
MKPWVYTLLYKIGAPWEIGVRPELRQLIESGRILPEKQPRVLDFGCGSGDNDVFLAQRGFDVVGVDFTPIALRRAHERVGRAGVGERCRVVSGDVTDPALLSHEEPFDLLLDFGTLDDMRPEGRQAMADNVHRLSASGSVFVMWCFYGDKHDLPLLKFNGVSRMHAVVEPGEETKLFGDAFDIERLPEPAPETHIACFFMTRR